MYCKHQSIYFAMFFLLIAPSTGIFTYPKVVKVQVHKDFVYQLNSSKAIEQAQWGLWYTNNSDLKVIFFGTSGLNPHVDSKYKGRLEYFGDFLKGYAWYKLTNLTMIDNGRYGVKITVQGLSQSYLRTSLIVTETPQFTGKPNNSTVITEHKDLSINCSAIGPPIPYVKWINVSDNMAAVNNGNEGYNVLKIPNITRHYNGQKYKCEAENNPNEGPSETSTVLQVNYKPEFALFPINTTVIQGNDIILNCLATSIPGSTITWKRESRQLKHGYSVASNGTLTIPKAKKTDAGMYICNASNNFDEQVHSETAHAYVVVKYEPSIFVHTSRRHVVNKSDAVVLTCKANGYPRPTITWASKRGVIKTLNSGKDYTIFNISKGDAGTYICTASNGIGKNATANIEVIVQYKPSIDLLSSNITAESWEDKHIKLRCKWLDSLPKPTWSWYYPNGTLISSNILTINKGSEVTLTTGSNNGDYGLYTCKATNEAGSVCHSINVTRLFPPGPPNVAVTNVDASSAQIQWTKPAYNGGSRITGYKVEVNQNTHNLSAQIVLKVISDLGNNKNYEVKVWAKNVVGYGSFSVKTFKTKLQGKPALPELKAVEILEKSVKLSWSKPADNGGNISNYTVYQKEVGVDEEWKQVAMIYGDVLREMVIPKLEPGKKYSFIVTASNRFGESPIDNEKKRTIDIPVQTTTPAITDIDQPSKGKSSGPESNANQTVIIVGAVVAVVLIVITAIISIIILRKKDILGKRKPSSNHSAAYHNDGQTTPDSLDRGAAVVNLHDHGEPTYAAVDKTIKSKKKGQNENPNYAAVDKSKKKKRPGEIIYAELADFNTNNIPAAPRPVPSYTGTDYADITQFQNLNQQEPTYANFSARTEEYNM